MSGRTTKKITFFSASLYYDGYTWWNKIMNLGAGKASWCNVTSVTMWAHVHPSTVTRTTSMPASGNIATSDVNPDSIVPLLRIQRFKLKGKAEFNQQKYCFLTENVIFKIIFFWWENSIFVFAGNYFFRAILSDES